MGIGVKNAVLKWFFRLQVFKPFLDLKVFQANGCVVLSFLLW